MDLRSGSPYWLLHTPLLHTYNTLKRDIKTEIAIIGSGISGALAAYELIKQGYKVTIFSHRHVGTVSTCASTSLLQYEIDTPLYELIDKVGAETAQRSYLLCSKSIDKLQAIHRQLGLSKTFKKRKSLLLASHLKDVPDLHKEYNERKSIDLKAQWLPEKVIKEKFGFKAPAAIYSTQGAQTDAYLFTQTLIHWCVLKGATVYDKTEITGIRNHPRSVELKTKDGYTITAQFAIMATGYEAVKWVDKKIARLHSTYVITSEPFPEKQLWKDECLIWETARPYTYFRITDDNRIVVGGRDEPFNSPGKRDKLISKKSKQLLHDFHNKFPGLKFNIEHAWAGTFAETKDGLPYIGPTKRWPRVLFALGYGGNGITFSQIASEIIRDIITGKKNPDINRFSFYRRIATK